MESRTRVVGMYFGLYFFLGVQFLLTYFGVHIVTLWPPISDEYIQEGKQSFWWCNVQVTFQDSPLPECNVETWLRTVCVVFYLFVYLSIIRKTGYAISIWDCSPLIPHPKIWMFSPFMAIFAYLNEFTISAVPTCVPMWPTVEQFWSNSKWNSTDAWLKHANKTSVREVETIHSLFVRLNVCCFVGYNVMVIFIVLHFYKLRLDKIGHYYWSCAFCGKQEKRKKRNKEGKRVSSFKVCRKCKQFNFHLIRNFDPLFSCHYCSDECQRKDWKVHKVVHKKAETYRRWKVKRIYSDRK